MTKVKNKKRNIIISILVIAILMASGIIIYSNAKKNKEAELAYENYKTFMYYFGIIDQSEYYYGDDEGTSIDMSVIYNSEVISKIELWEEQGVAGWMGWEKGQVEAMKKYIDDKISEGLLSDEKKEACKKVLEGGYEIIGEDDSIPDMEWFISFTDYIERAYNNTTNIEFIDDGLDIPEAWRAFIKSS